MKIYLTFFLLLSLCLVSLAQTASTSDEQTKALKEINKLNEQIIELYKESKFDEAASAGKKIQNLVNQNNLTSDARLSVVFANIAEVYLAKSKESEAVALLEIVAAAYEKMGDKGRNGYEKTLSRLAYAYSMNKDFKNAESAYLKLKNLTETVYGEKSRQAANAYLYLANIYNLQGKASEADDYYLKAILINDKVLTDTEKETRTDVDNYVCSIYHREVPKNGFKNTKTLFEDLDKKRGFSPDDNLNQGIINGKAKKLVVPHYPESARSKRLTGFAIVRVDIDEQGSVTKARAYCGFLEFVKEVENAALKSTFTPTLENGVPIKVTGDIVYNFVAQ